MTRTLHPRGRRTGRTRTARAAVGLGALAALLLTGCGGSDGDSDQHDHDAAKVEGGSSPKKGSVLDRPFEKPDLTLTDTTGEEYDLIEATKGRPTLLYFGYTHCPDVCPLTMGNIAVAKSKLPKAQQKRLRVVFVTSDPKRDTPRELGKWLRSQDPSFVGLTGDFDTIQAGARSVGISIEPSYKKKNGDVVSTHGAQVLAFSPKDDRAHVLYGENVPESTYTKDLPRLVKGENP
ncbi:SCO family protein [Streptomyces sp. NPDC005438]|uniref:SCO family protein n=1 Tax=Streptomyces sp. NPDC005438 TaxID=3156880 RepID=UPI0033B54EC9